MKTVELTITKGGTFVASQPIYSDGAKAIFGDGRQGEEQYVAKTSGSFPPVGQYVVFHGQQSGRTIAGKIAAREGLVTGDAVVTVELSL